jgi:hypothetical protein
MGIVFSVAAGHRAEEDQPIGQKVHKVEAEPDLSGIREFFCAQPLRGWIARPLCPRKHRPFWKDNG